MRIALISDFLEYPSPLGQRSEITWINSNWQGSIPEADLYIWDYTPGRDVKACVLLRPGAQHLILTDSKYSDAAGLLQTAVCILLRPVTPSTLKAFVELAFNTWEAHRQAREVATLRLDRDALLAYVLDVNLRLQEYDHERSNFIARALHDFRAPLTALHGYCGLLAEGKLGDVTGDQRELLQRMCYSTNRLARLSGGTLELLLQGRFEKIVELRESDFEETLSQALHDVYPFLQDKRLDVDIDITPPAGSLSFEPEQIQQVLVNLLENSCKFTPAKGNIRVRGYPVDGNFDRNATSRGQETSMVVANAYRVDISDSGPGVPRYLAERIFEEYASYSGVADRSGGGLGLAICRAIITAHHGTIWASPSDDGGMFSFVLPLTPQATPLIDPVEIEAEPEHAQCR